MNTETYKFPIWLLLILAPLFWSGNFFVGAALKAAIPPFTLAFYRWLLVVILMFPFVYKSFMSQFAIIKFNFIKIAILSFLSITCYTSLLYLALHSTEVISAGVINAIIPMMIVFFGILIGTDQFDLKK